MSEFPNSVSIRPVIVSETDPTSTLGAGVVWVQPSTKLTKLRNTANTDWDLIGGRSPDLSIYDPGIHNLVRNFVVNAGTTLNINDGFPAGLSVVGTSTDGSGFAGVFAIQTSGGASGDRATFISSNTMYQIQWARTLGELAIRFLVVPNGTIANIRMWVGLCIDDISDEATSTPAKSYAVFRYATDIDGTAFWRCVTDNGSGSPTVTITTIPVTVNTLYKFRIRWINDGSYIKFYSDDVLVATHTTKIFSTSTLFRWIASIKALAAEVKSIGVQWCNHWQ